MDIFSCYLVHEIVVYKTTLVIGNTVTLQGHVYNNSYEKNLIKMIIMMILYGFREVWQYLLKLWGNHAGKLDMTDSRSQPKTYF
jgi:hypothetical protein